MVFVLDRHQKPLMPRTENRAGRAFAGKMDPFTICLKDRMAEESVFQPLQVKFDPGSKETGMAMVLEGAKGPKIILFGIPVDKAEIKARLDGRRALRGGRQHRKTRYRKPSFQNGKRKAGWLPPSLEAGVDQTPDALTKIRKLAPVTDLSGEHVRCDTKKLETPEISTKAFHTNTAPSYNQETAGSIPNGASAPNRL